VSASASQVVWCGRIRYCSFYLTPLLLLPSLPSRKRRYQQRLQEHSCNIRGRWCILALGIYLWVHAASSPSTFHPVLVFYDCQYYSFHIRMHPPSGNNEWIVYFPQPNFTSSLSATENRGHIFTHQHWNISKGISNPISEGREIWFFPYKPYRYLWRGWSKLYGLRYTVESQDHEEKVPSFINCQRNTGSFSVLLGGHSSRMLEENHDLTILL
jgi:hypothetical protein